jgi:hypothetical protein
MGSTAQGRGRRVGARRRRADGDNGATRRPGRRGTGQGIPVPGDGPRNGLHVGKAKSAAGEKRGSGSEGENWPKRFREKNFFLFSNPFYKFQTNPISIQI